MSHINLPFSRPNCNVYIFPHLLYLLASYSHCSSLSNPYTLVLKYSALPGDSASAKVVIMLCWAEEFLHKSYKKHDYIVWYPACLPNYMLWFCWFTSSYDPLQPWDPSLQNRYAASCFTSCVYVADNSWLNIELFAYPYWITSYFSHISSSICQGPG